MTYIDSADKKHRSSYPKLEKLGYKVIHLNKPKPKGKSNDKLRSR
jgi:hypothetical protein